jgi:hypothetical protein
MVLEVIDLPSIPSDLLGVGDVTTTEIGLNLLQAEIILVACDPSSSTAQLAAALHEINQAKLVK